MVRPNEIDHSRGSGRPRGNQPSNQVVATVARITDERLCVRDVKVPEQVETEVAGCFAIASGATVEQVAPGDRVRVRFRVGKEPVVEAVARVQP